MILCAEPGGRSVCIGCSNYFPADHADREVGVRQNCRHSEQRNVYELRAHGGFQGHCIGCAIDRERPALLRVNLRSGLVGRLNLLCNLVKSSCKNPDGTRLRFGACDDRDCACHYAIRGHSAAHGCQRPLEQGDSLRITLWRLSDLLLCSKADGRRHKQKKERETWYSHGALRERTNCL